MDQNDEIENQRCGRLNQFISSAARDLGTMPNLLRNERLLKKYSEKNVTVADAFRENLKADPKKVCIMYNDESWTFQDVCLTMLPFFIVQLVFSSLFLKIKHYLKVEDYSNRVGNAFQREFNLKKGDCVAVFIENCPQFVGIWLGLSKLGVISAFINTNLKTQQLIHTINSSNAKALIYTNELETCKK